MSQLKDVNAEISCILLQLEHLKTCNEAKSNRQLIPTLYQKMKQLQSQVSSSTASVPSIPSLYMQNKLKRSQSLILCDGKSGENFDVKHLTDELKRTKEKLSKPCEMCKNYELQLQSVENTATQLRKQLALKDSTIKECKDELKKEHDLKIELEEKFIKEAKETEKQIQDLESRLSESNLFTIYYNEANEKIATVRSLNDKLQNHLRTMMSENEALLGRYIVKSQELQSEVINLPQDINEMQFHCLKLREDLITALTIKERNEETHRNQNTADQQAKENLAENLARDNESLKNLYDSLDKDFKELKSRFNEQEIMLRQCQEQIAMLIQENEQHIFSNSELMNEKLKYEEENMNLRSKIQSLQIELDNSEAVQRDFVKLSQSLQIQLEKIRQADVEVRWQHDDDVKDCNQCKKIFHSKKEKMHCAHCGKIFCSDCNNKLVYGGPNRRQFKVCSVCHTLLDRETAPYFSNEPPQSPS
ncbi:rab GTPase-binding effector protein 1-like protein [Dinothrombium tinctorium]|uniref:Rab GTPase-binding effector protein 1-like protein n=1 Tax=Dinothrombium tinctorium TaxID=1965070 RepID=A0A443QRJ4_9ACAR|nr:rab GTPase-binding effector protein 1-like protein [Dinothrombium tinctorium]